MDEKKLQAGDSFSAVHHVTREAVHAFAEVTGDTNPVHLDEGYAATTAFKKPIAHGMLVAGYVSAILGTELPGRGSIYLGQTLQFKKPVFVGDTVTVRVEIVGIREDKPVVTLLTEGRNASGEIVLTGEAVMLCPLAILKS